MPICIPQRTLCIGDLLFQHLPYLLDCEGITEVRAFFKVPEVSAKSLKVFDLRPGFHDFQVVPKSLHLFIESRL
jgi:hypothetical protein